MFYFINYIVCDYYTYKKGNHIRNGKQYDIELYDTNIENINVIGKYKIYNFYTKDIESKVYQIYKKDFEYFANNRIA